MRIYAGQLANERKDNPQKYAWPDSEIGEVLRRTREAVLRGTFSKDSAAHKKTCAILGIKHTYRAIADYIAPIGDKNA